MSFKAYPSIGQLRDSIKNTQKENETVPVIDYVGTVKLHGTHGDIVQTVDGTIFAQSRNRVLTVQNDNLGFAAYVAQLKNISQLFQKIRDATQNYSDQIMIAGEWCGKGIQKGVALEKVEKMFVIFDILVNDQWKNMIDFKDLHDNSERIYNIYQFPVWYKTVSFVSPRSVQEELIALTEQVENECPAGKYFGVSNGVGEGLVWKPVDLQQYPSPSYWFKTKGNKHRVCASSSREQIASLAVQMYDDMLAFAIANVSENRCEQGLSYLREMHGEPTIKQLGDFSKWVCNDIHKEEGDTIEENGWSEITRELNKEINKISIAWYKNKFV